MNPGIGQLRTIVRAVTGAGRALRLSDQLHDETLSNVGEDIYDDSRSIISSRPISMVKSLKSHRPLVSGAHGDVRESAHEEGLAGEFQANNFCNFISYILYQLQED